MRILIRAKTNAKKESIEKIAPLLSLFSGANTSDVYKVSVCQPPVDGKANDAIIRVLAKHFNVAPSLITIVSGQTSSIKTIEIHND